MINSTAISAVVLLSSALGFAGGYFYAHYKLDADYEKNFNQEISALREKYYKVGKDREDDVLEREVTLRETQEYLNDVTDAVKRKYGIDNPYEDLHVPNEDERINYNKIREKYQTDTDDGKGLENVEQDTQDHDIVEQDTQDHDEEVDDEMDDEMDDIIANLPDDEEQKEPYFITERMFYENIYRNEQCCVSYFAKDDFVLDERDDMLDNTDKLFGDLLSKIDADGEDLYYIRNNGMKLDIEVEVIKSSYEEVTGRF